MILLAFCLLTWSLSVVLVACISWVLSLLLRIQFYLDRAEILIVEPHEDIKTVDVTEEMRALGNGPAQTLSVLPRLAKVAPHKVGGMDPDRGVGKATTAIMGGDECRRSASATPFCFVDIRYRAQPNRVLGLLLDGRRCAGSYRCLYPLYSYSDAILYPPLRGSEWFQAKKSQTKRSSISSAVLTMRIQGRPTCQLLCNVTDRLRPLEGPFHDFHRKSHPGYQLRKHILRAVLGSDIQALHDSASRVNGGGNDGTTPSSSASSSSCSSSSSLSLAESPPRSGDEKANAVVGSNPCSMSISVRFQFHSHDHRIDVMTLRAY